LAKTSRPSILGISRSSRTKSGRGERAKARECQKHAEQTRDPFIKQQLLDIAEKWRTMAAYEEKYAR
jgi:hypothetical protein